MCLLSLRHLPWCCCSWAAAAEEERREKRLRDERTWSQRGGAGGRGGGKDSTRIPVVARPLLLHSPQPSLLHHTGSVHISPFFCLELLLAQTEQLVLGWRCSVWNTGPLANSLSSSGQRFWDIFGPGFPVGVQ